MRNSKVLKGILIFLGLFLIIIGSWRLIDPIAAFEGLGLTLSNNVGLLNEARGTAGAMIGLGFLILLGTFKKKITFTSTLVATVFFLGFGIARIIAVILDGNPGNALLTGIITEFAFGILALFALIKYCDRS
jgi:hypothetical protein